MPMNTLKCERCGATIRTIAREGWHATCPKKEVGSGKVLPKYKLVVEEAQ
jgi:hypothetical protein